MPSLLETTTALLDRKAVAFLGDTFTYAPATGQAVNGVLGFVDYAEDIANPDHRAAGAITQVIVIELLASLFPTRPTAACRVSALDRYPDDIWQPIGIVASDKGFWRFSIKKVAA